MWVWSECEQVSESRGPQYVGGCGTWAQRARVVGMGWDGGSGAGSVDSELPGGARAVGFQRLSLVCHLQRTWARLTFKAGSRLAPGRAGRGKSAGSWTGRGGEGGTAQGSPRATSRH